MNFEPERTVFVRHLNNETTPETLKKVFEKYGIITRVLKIKGRGWGFVEFAELADAVNTLLLFQRGEKVIIDEWQIFVTAYKKRIKKRPAEV